MEFTIFMEYIENIALFTVLTFFMVIIINKFTLKPLIRKIVFGIFFSVLSILAMELSIEFADGIMYDARFLIASFSGFVGGPVCGIITVIVSVLWRINIGGIGMFAGVTGIILSCILGIYLFFFNKSIKKDLLYFSIFGIVLSIISVTIFFIIPISPEQMKSMIPTIMSVIPATTIFATIVMGTIIEHENHLVRLVDKANEEKVSSNFLAYNDKLTGIPNRNSVMETIKNFSTDEVPFYIAFLDMDNFKLINDTHGHAVGDSLLIAFSDFLRNQVYGKNAYCGRLGGDEFVILLVGHTESDCTKYLDHIVNRLKKPFVLDKIQTIINISIGVAKYPDDAKNISNILKCADIVMYEAKKHYGSNYMFFKRNMFANFDRKVNVEDHLRTADIESEFYLRLQPQISVDDGLPVGFESLVRWNNPVLGVVSPNEFIPIAEGVGYISAIGRFVIESSCRAIAKLQEAHNKKYRISINTSSYELSETGYIDFLMSTINKYRISPSNVEIEITERIMLELNDAVYAKIAMLKDLGIRIALDDFGIGLSSIQNLKKISFDTVKIDKEFVQVLDKNTIDVRILTSIVDMLNVFGVDIIAEGVETKAQFNNVFKNKIKTIQGFYTGSPQDVHTILKKYQT